MMLIKDGVLIDPRVTYKPFPNLAHGPLSVIDAIVLHQTGSSTAESVFQKYGSKTSKDHTGAHFLLDKDGTMYQTLAVTLKCAHVAPIRARCLAEATCSKEDSKLYKDILADKKKGYGEKVKEISANEAKKSYPDRYPWNPDSIGIEVVGLCIDDKTYEPPTTEQVKFIAGFLPDLLGALKLTTKDVYRHPTLSYKNPGEAAGIAW